MPGRSDLDSLAVGDVMAGLVPAISFRGALRLSSGYFIVSRKPISTMANPMTCARLGTIPSAR